MSRLGQMIGKALGVDPEKVDGALDADRIDEIAKGMPTTFAERMAQRELDDELPDAMSVLRSCIFWAFNPPSDAGNVDPKAVISESLDQFKTWALGLVDRTNGDAVAKMIEQSEAIEKAVLDAASRAKLPDSAFVFPKDRRFPIHDLAHARNALARAAGKPEEAKVKAAVFAKFPQLKNGKVAKADGPTSDSGTVKTVSKLDEIIGSGDEQSVEDRISDLEETVAKITPENIAKAIAKQNGDGNGDGEGDGSGDESGSGDGEGKASESGDGNGAEAKGGDQPVTKAQLEAAIQKIVDDASEKVNDLSDKIEKLGEGDTSQGKDDVAKAESRHQEKVAKAMEAEGFSEKDAADLGGIFD